MKFSLTYPEYRLLDVKALSEYHAACVATDLDFESDQSLLSLKDTNLSDREKNVFRHFCECFYRLSRFVDLELYWEIFHTIAHLGEGDHVIKQSNIVLHYTIDLDDFLMMFSRFAEIAFSENGEYLCDTLSKIDITEPFHSGISMLDEIFDLISKLDSHDRNGIVAVLGDSAIKNELSLLKVTSIAYYFRELFCILRPDNSEDTRRVAFAAVEDIQKYMRKSLIDSYGKIWFDGETALSIYADLPSLREGLVNEAKRQLRGKGFSNITYEDLRQKYVTAVKRLTFSQDNNRTAIYEKYIAAQVIHAGQWSGIYAIEEQTSVIVSQSSDGKACAIVDKPQNKTAALKHAHNPKPTIEPGRLLVDIASIDEATIKQKMRCKLNVLSLPHLRQDFGYSELATKKYPIMLKDGSLEPVWQYSHHSFADGMQEPRIQGIIRERTLPMYHCVTEILGPELISKQEALTSVWNSVCSQTKYKRHCSFAVSFADSEYLSSVTADASCRTTSINKARPFVQYVMEGTFRTDNWLYEAYRLQAQTDPNLMFDAEITPEEYESYLADLNRNNGRLLSEEGISMLSKYKRVVNEVYRLDAALKEDGYSFSKFWYTYLAENFVRERMSTKSICSATEYTANLLSLPTGYHPLASRYSATDFAEQNSDYVRCRTTSFGNIMHKLMSETEGKASTAFEVLKQQAFSTKHSVVSLNEPGRLEDTPLQKTVRFIESIYNDFTCNVNYTHLKHCIASVRGEGVSNVNNFSDISIQTCMIHGLQCLVDLGLGEWVCGQVGIDQFQVKYGSSLANGNPIGVIDGISKLYRSILDSPESQLEFDRLKLMLRIPFLLLALFYTLPTKEYETYRSMMGPLGIPTGKSSNARGDYESGVGMDMQKVIEVCIIIARYLNDPTDYNNLVSYRGNKQLIRLLADNTNKLLRVLVVSQHKNVTTAELVQLIKDRFVVANNIIKSLSRELKICHQHLPYLLAACRTATIKHEFRSTALLLALNNFGEHSSVIIKTMNVNQCNEQVATAADFALLEDDLFDMESINASAAEAENDSQTSVTEPGAVEFMQRFIDCHGDVAGIIENEGFSALAGCPYFVYMLGCLIGIMCKTVELKPQIHCALQEKLYLETDYRPYAAVGAETSEICKNIYNNLVYILENNVGGAAGVLSLPGGILSSNRDTYNIAQEGQSGYDRDMFDFICCKTADEQHSTGLVFTYLRPSEDRPAMPYYLHRSGMYICGAQFAAEDMTSVKLFFSEDEINATSY